MKDIEVKVYPASNGESILVTCKGKTNTNILVDCGYVSTYKYIKKDLEKIKCNNEKIDLLVLTHIDNDHINGARMLFKDYLDGNICEIAEVWYNDYFSIYDIESNNKEICESEYSVLKLLKNDVYPPDPNESGEKNISFKSANILVDYLQKDMIKEILNKSFKGAVFVGNELLREGEKSIRINDEVEIILLGPTKDILLELLRNWREYLKNEGFEKEVVKSEELAKAFELFYVNKIEELSEMYSFDKECSSNNKLENFLQFDIRDKKIENRSSISFILKFYDKYLLFLGDSSPSDYEETLSIALKQQKINFDLIKVSHHGSKYNTTKNLFEMVNSKRYIVSTNGEVFNHPDLETIAKIMIKQEQEKKVYFNYKIPKVEEFLEDYNLLSNTCKVSYGNKSLLGENIQLVEIKDDEDEL